MRVRFPAAIVLFSAILFSCKTGIEVTTESASISGKALFTNCDDYSGILVTLGKTNGLESTTIKNFTTKSNGAYKFTELEAGTYTIYASSNSTSEKAVAANIVVEKDKAVTAADLCLTATGSISGKITLDGSTTGNTGFTVFAAGTSFMAETSDDGSFTISDVPCGTSYQIVIKKGDFTYILTDKVEVTAAATKALSTINFTSDQLLDPEGKGVVVIWLGSFEDSKKIENPEKNDAYFNLTDGCSYVYDGTEWKLLADLSTRTTFPVVGIKINKYELSVRVGETEDLTASVIPSYATNKTITWESDKTTIATVDSDGTVTGVKEGTAVITAKAENGTVTETCTVTVSPMTTTLPVIRIQTTDPKDPDDPLAFVTDPVSDTVKWHATSWGDYGYFSYPSPWYETCTVTVEDENQNVKLDGVGAKVKARGNWTTSYKKKGLKIKFDEKHKMLGMHNGKKFKNWVLVAAWKDYSMIRDYTAYNLARLIDDKYYASDAKFVEVYINDNYWGVYLVVEQQEAKRVGITEAVADDGIVNTGYLIEYDSYGVYIQDKEIDGEPVEQDFFIMNPYGNFHDLNGERVTNNLNQYYTIKSEYDDSKKAFIKSYMDNLWIICRDAIQNNTYKEFNSSNTALVNSTTTSAEECISKVLDIDSLVDTVIMQEIACDLDLHWSSFYMDLDLNPENVKPLTFEAPWDFDSSFGNHTKRQIGTADGQISHLFSVTSVSPCDGNPWTVLFNSAEWFQKKVQAKWAAMKAAGVKEAIIAMINKISDDPAYIAAFQKNFYKWPVIGTSQGDEICDEGVAVKTQRQAADVVINYINKRFAMLDDDFATYTSSNPAATDTDTKSYSYSYNNTSYTDTMKVVAEEDGLHITGNMDSCWTHVSIYVYDDTLGKALPWIDNIVVTSESEFIYKYVEKGHIYNLWYVSMNSSWGNYHTTENAKVRVKAKDGTGDIYIDRGDYTIDKTAHTITYDYFKVQEPDEIDIIGTGNNNLSVRLFDGIPYGTNVSNTDNTTKAQDYNSNNNSIVYTIDGSLTSTGETESTDFWGKTNGGINITYTFKGYTDANKETEVPLAYRITESQLW